MLWFLLSIVPELTLSQVIDSAELTSSATAVFHKSVTLTCVVQGNDLTDFSTQIDWFKSNQSNNEAEQLHTDIISNTNSTSFEFEVDSDRGSGQYFCSANETIISNYVSIFFRSLTMRQLPKVAPVYKNQQVEIQIIQEGDVGSQIQCKHALTGNALSHSIIAARQNFLEVKAKFKLEKTAMITCEAAFSDETLYSMNTTIVVLVPEWGEWGPYSENCEIRPEKMYQCAKMRTRNCTNYSEFSACEGDQNSFLDCDPDDCEPTVTDWGVWSETCQFNSNLTACQKSRERFCTVAVNSTRTCTESLVDFTDCPLEQCDKWSEWQQWSGCAQPVEQRQSCTRERERHCLLSGLDCAGSSVDMSNCERRECGPKFKSHGRRVIKISYQDPFYLVCDVESSRTVGYQGMSVQWKRDSLIIVPLVGVEPDTLRYTDESLREDETGIYTCCVRNEFSTRCRDSWDVRLSDHGPVKSRDFATDVIIPLTVERGHNITLHCHLEGYNIQFTWSHGNQILHGKNEQTLQIVSMSKEKQGHYSCCGSDSVFGKHVCLPGYEISEPVNTQRKYLIITITVIALLLLVLILYITCAHTNKMNSFKRRFRHMFSTGHTKLYNGLDPYETGQVIQRSQSYLKRLSKTRPLSKSELAVLVSTLGETVDPNSDYHDNNELGIEFEGIPNNTITINKTPVGTENKNRYLNVLPNPHSRVLLPELGSDPTSTYVNANYIRGYKLVPKEYVATQGPLPATKYDFWRLVWEEKCRIIVMTTGLIENSRMKCCLYWPATEIGHTMKSGDMEITQLGIYPSRFYTISIMRVKKMKEEEEDKVTGKKEEKEEKDEEEAAEDRVEDENAGRIIYHMWYHSWPDFGVPEDTGPFLDFVESVRAFKSALENAPVLVHCSAGIGRTGTFISVNLGIEQFTDNGKVDPLGYICQLRQDRGGMIQTLDQYTFVYRALHAYQLRLMSRDQESKDKTLIKFGPHELLEDNEFLPPGIDLPIVEDIAGSKVDRDFVKCLTQTIRSVSRYSDSTTSLNNMNVKASTESLHRDVPASGSPQNGADKPLLAAENSKQKRRSKVKSLFFPLTPRDKSKGGSTTSSTQDLRSLGSPHRSLSLNNVKFSKSRENVSLSPRVSLSNTSQKRVSVTSSKSAGTDCSIQVEN